METVTPDQATEDLKQFGELFELNGVEIFKTGIHNGDKYVESDIDAMVAAFDEVGFRPPIKLGHKEESGDPAYGWVKAIRKQGDTLVADFSDLPQKVYEAISNRQFDTVSSEILFNLNRNGKKFARALKGVALLGAEIPGVSGLKPLRECFSAEDEYKVIELAIQPEPTDEVETDEDEGLDMAEDQIAALTAEIKQLKTDLAAAQEPKEDERVTQLTAELEQVKEDRRKELVQSKVNDCVIPSFRPRLEALYNMATTQTEQRNFSIGGNEESAVEVIDGFTKMLNSQSEWLLKTFSEDEGDAKAFASTDDEVDAKTKQFAAEHKVSYSDAMNAVLDSDPDLKQRYNEGA